MVNHLLNTHMLTKIYSYALILFFGTSNLIAMDYGLNQKLLRAAEVGFAKRIPILIKDGANKNFQDKEGNTPLHLAVENGHINCAHELLATKSNPNVFNNKGEMPLLIACKNRDLFCTKVLLAAGANPNNLLFKEIQGINPGVHENTKTMPLIIAVGSKQLEIVKALLEAKADPNLRTRYDGYTTLTLATYNNDPQIVEVLLAAKANTEDVCYTQFKATSLFIAAQDGFDHCVRLLLSNWADTEKTPILNYNKGPLHVAAQNGHIECVKTLLTARANIDAKDENGNTPADLACRNNCRNNQCARIAEMLQGWPKYLEDKQQANLQYLAFFKAVFSPESLAYKLSVELHRHIYKFYTPLTIDQFFSKY